LNRIPYSLVFVQNRIDRCLLGICIRYIWSDRKYRYSRSAHLSRYQSSQTRTQLKETQKQTKQAQEQTRLTRKEMEITLRAWLGLIDPVTTYPDRIEFLFKNHGRIPAKVLQVRIVRGNKKITQQELRSSKPESKVVIIFPDGTMPFQIPISIDFEYVGILVDYEFAENKRGESSSILRKNPITDHFEFQDAFAS